MRDGADNTLQPADLIEVHTKLREAILHGDLAPDAEISQVQLAEQYGVGRTPLREALRMLQREGLIESERNRKMRVAGFSLTDMEQLYATRIALEAPAIRVTTALMKSADLGRLEGDLAQMTHFAEEKNYEEWEVPHREFHARLVSKAGDRFVGTLAELSDHCERYRRLYTTQEPLAWSAGVSEHRAIVDACRERDPDAAAAHLALHLAHVVCGVIELVDPAYETDALDAVVAVACTPVSSSAELQSQGRKRTTE